MDIAAINSILTIGETAAVEFKRCGNGIESDTYETVCSFLNRFGGDIFMGILDDGTVLGVPEKSAPDMIKNFIKVVSNPALFMPTVYLVPEIIRYDEKRTIIHVHIPPSAEVHSYKKVIYDRVDDADVKVTATSAIAQMYIRKQTIFTEKKIYPYAKMNDLRLDLLPKVRQLAVNHAGGTHPWAAMSDQEMLKSAGLYGFDIATGEEGYNLAAIMLLGRDEVILNVAPAYVTDALVRKVNVDRYDDREIVKTNLIDSYDLLFHFAKKHLPDKFFLEDTVNKSLRNIIVREMIANTLIHREYSSSYTAKYVIENDRMYVENANRAIKDGHITMDNLEPNPKNPIIAAFFRNIGYADQLGSGVRNLFKYTKYYSGQEPEFIEGDVFRIIVPLDEAYSYDFGSGGRVADGNDTKAGTNGVKVNTYDIEVGTNGTEVGTNSIKIDVYYTNHIEKNSKDRYEKYKKEILNLIEADPKVTQKIIQKEIGLSLRTIKRLMSEMQGEGNIKRIGSPRSGEWHIGN
ncbi:MAG: putative DNA binding domain-containing protein [Lachnospiraceae bacterium]|nr:putative DNA binding domain-containing protein [Lachnospiraceae bacterium]